LRTGWSGWRKGSGGRRRSSGFDDRSRWRRDRSDHAGWRMGDSVADDGCFDPVATFVWAPGAGYVVFPMWCFATETHVEEEFCFRRRKRLEGKDLNYN